MKVQKIVLLCGGKESGIFMYNIFETANWFLEKEPMSHKKLQKLCYYTQAWSYALKNKPFINAEFQAWVHGPVSPVLFDKYRGMAFEDIDPDTSAGKPNFKNDELELLENIWETYGNSTGNSLEVLTHKELPWIKARIGYGTYDKCEKIISADDMREYYRSIYDGDLDIEA